MLATSLLPAFNNGASTENAQTLSKRNPSPQEHKLRKAAVEFESILISTFWKSMLETFSDDDDSSDPGHSTFEDMGLQAMSQAMSKAGGLGLGGLMIKHLEPLLESTTSAEGAVKQ
jgi:Rod binding domain-containing protein